MKKLSLLATVIIGLLTVSSATFAQSTYAQTHPRRHEVTARLSNQNRRIHNEVSHGDMSRAEAARLHRQDRRIRTEERRMARRDHGHITPQEQARLNRQENRVSKKIGS